MTSPNARPSGRLTWLSNDDSTFPLPTRSSTLALLMRTRSQQSLQNSSPGNPPARRRSEDDGGVSSMEQGRNRDGGEIGKLLRDERRMSKILQGPNSRSMNLIGASNPRYQWEQYWRQESELSAMKRPIRKYYQRTNELIEQCLYIDCLLDSAIPHELLDEYSNEPEASAFSVPDTINEESSTATPSAASPKTDISNPVSYGTTSTAVSESRDSPPTSSNKTKRGPKDIFVASENLPLLHHTKTGELPSRPSDGSGPKPSIPWLEDADLDSDDPVVTLAIWVNMIANAILLVGKVVVVSSVPSMSVIASLVDAVLDFLSTAIVWITTRLISSSQKDQYRYPVGRRRLEPLGVLVFSIIMITSFCQVGLECIQRLLGPDHRIIELGIPAIAIMVGTIVIKGAVWLWCRMVKNSSVRALAADAVTDVVFNTGSILFPIIGYYASIWWLDAVGGLLLSAYVIISWSKTSGHHVRNLTGFSAQPDERNLLLYLTMRFAASIRKIQNLRAYHAGDKLFVEVDIVLSANTPLKDSHDLSEVLTYFLESVPIVDRAFVHVDYVTYNVPTHIVK